MIPVRITVETREGVVEYIAHVVNRSKHALHGAIRNAWRRYPAAKAVAAEYTLHDCEACRRAHPEQAIRRTYNRKPSRRRAS